MGWLWRELLRQIPDTDTGLFSKTGITTVLEDYHSKTLTEHSVYIFQAQINFLEYVCSVVSNSLQLDGLSLPDSSVQGTFQSRILESVLITFSRGSSQPRD